MTPVKKLTRWLQLATGVHQIHHIQYSYGWKLPFTIWGYFPRYAAGSRVTPWHRVARADYHDCTMTGRY